MEIWIDSIDTSLIVKAKAFGLLKGVTTNPSILKSSSSKLQTIETLLEIQQGPITLQVQSFNSEEMIQQGLAYREISDRIIVKIPVIQEGLKAISALKEKAVPVMATVIYNARQYFLAAQAGADYAAPYINAIQDTGIEAEIELSKMCKIKSNYGFKTKILAASIATLEQIDFCLNVGIDAMTLKKEIFEQLIENDPHTIQRVEKFISLEKVSDFREQ
jgi:TalC/MipB family fructose-6-phosphate aldolase